MSQYPRTRLCFCSLLQFQLGFCLRDMLSILITRSHISGALGGTLGLAGSDRLGRLFMEPAEAVVSRQSSVPDVQLMPESTVSLGCFGIMGFARGLLHIWLHGGVALRRRLVTPPT